MSRSLALEGLASAVARGAGLLSGAPGDLLLFAGGLAVAHGVDGLVGLLSGCHVNHLMVLKCIVIGSPDNKGVASCKVE